MQEAAGLYAPSSIWMSDGEPTDNDKRGLKRLKNNNWFKSAIKVAIAIGNDADKNVLAEFTGNKECVLTVHNKEQLEKIIHFVSVTASQVASRSASAGADAPVKKEDEFKEKLNDMIETSEDPVLSSIDSGTNASTEADDWGSWG